MKFSSRLIFILALIAGCSAKPLLKSSDPVLEPRKPPTPVPAAASATKPTRATSETARVFAPAPSSDPGYIVNCNGTDRTLTSCYEQADEICEAQKHFVSNILKIEESKSAGLIARSIIFRCNTGIDYGKVGFPDNGRLPGTGQKPTLQQKLLLGQ